MKRVVSLKLVRLNSWTSMMRDVAHLGSSGGGSAPRSANVTSTRRPGGGSPPSTRAELIRQTDNVNEQVVVKKRGPVVY